MSADDWVKIIEAAGTFGIKAILIVCAFRIAGAFLRD